MMISKEVIEKYLKSKTDFVLPPNYNYPKEEIYKSLIDLCERLSVNNISFINGRNDIRPLLKRFNVYICSSKAESSPISVWEAMSMSKPIVSTDVGDVSKYVKNNYNGFIISDHKELGLIIDQLLVSYPNEVKAFRNGKNKLQGFFVGQLMKKTSGKADPKLANKILLEKLKA